VTLHSPDQFAPVGVLHPTKFHLEEKFSLTPPPSLDSLVVSVTDDTVGEENLSVTVDNSGLMLVGIDSASFKLHITTVAQRHGVFTFSCWRQGDDSQDLDAGYELGVLLASLEAELQRNGRTWAYVVYVRLFLEDMGHFGRANEVYVQHITELKCERGVPSRCCMQLYLQKGGVGKAMVEVTVAPDLSKKVLHVQSISLWAPSCIGPYSQATLQGQVLHMAGQLGLDPPTMILVAGGVAAEMEQAVLNCEAVAQEFEISLCTCAITFTVYCSENIGADGQQQTEDILQSFLLRNKRCGDSDSSPTDVEKISTIGHPPLVLYVLVPALPKGAQVEIEPSAFVSSSSACFIDRDSIDDMSTRLEETASGRAWQCVQISSGKQEEAYLGDDDGEKQQGRKSLTTLCEGLILPTHFCRAFAFINVGSNDHASGLSHHLMQRNDQMQLDTNEFKMALEQCMEAVGQVLEQAHLSWSEITVFRIYYVAQLIAVADLQNSMKEILASCSRKAHTYDLQEQQPPPELPILEATFIPTGGVGHSSAVNALVAMDFTAMGSSRSSEHL